MRYPERGEVWLVDLGMTAKIRPCLVISAPIADSDRALVTLVPHTTAVRASQYEADVPVAFLKRGAFDAQGLVTVPPVRAVRMLGELAPSQMREVEAAVCRWLELPCASRES
ncbi:MAG: type II toxin-antitoxin system PemK/MazF family toxin [Acidobacteriota bacterium]|nr:type II toxin-antitoxin system PemK/MazF family toxin [Acidobacteriota bacterium]